MVDFALLGCAIYKFNRQIRIRVCQFLYRHRWSLREIRWPQRLEMGLSLKQPSTNAPKGSCFDLRCQLIWHPKQLTFAAKTNRTTKNKNSISSLCDYSNYIKDLEFPPSFFGFVWKYGTSQWLLTIIPRRIAIFGDIISLYFSHIQISYQVGCLYAIVNPHVSH
jgi:hypothetical protein